MDGNLWLYKGRCCQLLRPPAPREIHPGRPTKAYPGAVHRHRQQGNPNRVSVTVLKIYKNYVLAPAPLPSHSRPCFTLPSLLSSHIQCSIKGLFQAGTEGAPISIAIDTSKIRLWEHSHSHRLIDIPPGPSHVTTTWVACLIIGPSWRWYVFVFFVMLVCVCDFFFLRAYLHKHSHIPIYIYIYHPGEGLRGRPGQCGECGVEPLGLTQRLAGGKHGDEEHGAE